MNQHALHLEWTGPDQAGASLKAVLIPFCKAKLQAGIRLSIKIEELEDAKSEQQRKYYHRYVLIEIAEQAQINGEKFAMQVWKDYFRERFVGFKHITRRDPITGKKYRRKERISTENLGIKAYSKLIDQVTAFAATELGVCFICPNWESYRT